MKEQKNKLFLALLLLCFASLKPAEAMDVSVSYARFAYENEDYLEVYLHFVSGTLKADTLANQQVHSKSNVLILLKQGETIVAYEKYQLSSPASSKLSDFQDVKRFKVPKGEYVLEISTEDFYDPQNTFSQKKNISIDSDEGKSSFSDIQYLATVQSGDNGLLSKNGFSYEILPYEFYDSKYKQLNFYAELYLDTLQKEDLYLYTALFNDYAKNDTKKVLLQAIKKIDKKSIVPILKNFDIANLPSGNFHVQLEVRTKDGKTIAATNQDFQRSNPLVDFEALQSNDQIFESSFVHSLDETKLNYYLKAHIPIAQSAMNNVLNVIIDGDNIRSKKYFIYKYWTDQSKDYSQVMFEKFMTVADAIDKMFNSGFGHGFETDRGYYYLKYGRPSQSINVSDELATPPYEIWVYDRIEEIGQSNVKFVFYNDSLVNNDYRILHSNCRGEIRNSNWENVIYSNMNDPSSRRAGELFNDL